MSSSFRFKFQDVFFSMFNSCDYMCQGIKINKEIIKVIISRKKNSIRFSFVQILCIFISLRYLKLMVSNFSIKCFSFLDFLNQFRLNLD